MIIQVSQAGINARLELAGVELDDIEHSVARNMLLWLIGFLLGVAVLKKKNLDVIYKSCVVDSMCSAINDTNKILKALDSDDTGAY